MKRLSSRLFLFLLPLLTACGGGGSISAPFAQAPQGSSGAATLSEVQSDAAHRVVPESATTHLLYVGNQGNNSITVYQHDAAGNIAPTYVIAGSKTGINDPGQLSQDAAGNLYVANGTYNTTSTNPAVLVFAHGANGNVAPIRKIAGPLTGIHNISAMTVDTITGKIFVADYSLTTDPSGNRYNTASLIRFPPNANGNEAPFAQSATPEGSLGGMLQIASDSTGYNIIEAQTMNICCNGGQLGTRTVPKQFANGAVLGSLYSIAYFQVEAVADDPTTKTYVTSGLVRLA